MPFEGDNVNQNELISDLEPAYPFGADDIAEGDDHLRLIKRSLQNTFPNVNGAVTVTEDEINHLSGAASNVQDQLDAAKAVTDLLTAGTVSNNTLRWNGSQWVETSDITLDGNGQVIIPALAGVGQRNLAIDNSGVVVTQPIESSPIESGTVNNATLRWDDSAAQWVENTSITADGSAMYIASPVGNAVFSVDGLVESNTAKVSSLAGNGNRYIGVNTQGVMQWMNDPTSSDSRLVSGTNGQLGAWANGALVPTNSITTSGNGVSVGSLKISGMANAYIGVDASGTVVTKADPSGGSSLPAASNNNMLRCAGGTTWVADTNILSDGSTVGIGVNPSSVAELTVGGQGVYASTLRSSDLEGGVWPGTVAYDTNGRLFARPTAAQAAAQVTSTGTIRNNVSFNILRITKTGTGAYKIDYASPVQRAYISVTPVGTLPTMASVPYLDQNGCTVYTFGSDGVATDRSFDFMVF